MKMMPERLVKMLNPDMMLLINFQKVMMNTYVSDMMIRT